MAKYFKVKQVRSELGRLPKHIRTIKGLGLGGLGDEVSLPDTPSIRGMILQVQYLVKVTPVDGQLEKKTHPKRAVRREVKKNKKAA